jgi:outer membrane biosynthesis protein TonB
VTSRDSERLTKAILLALVFDLAVLGAFWLTGLFSISGPQEFETTILLDLSSIRIGTEEAPVTEDFSNTETDTPEDESAQSQDTVTPQIERPAGRNNPDTVSQTEARKVPEQIRPVEEPKEQTTSAPKEVTSKASDAAQNNAESQDSDSAEEESSLLGNLGTLDTALANKNDADDTESSNNTRASSQGNNDNFSLQFENNEDSRELRYSPLPDIDALQDESSRREIRVSVPCIVSPDGTVRVSTLKPMESSGNIEIDREISRTVSTWQFAPSTIDRNVEVLISFILQVN